MSLLIISTTFALSVNRSAFTYQAEGYKAIFIVQENSISRYPLHWIGKSINSMCFSFNLILGGNTWAKIKQNKTKQQRH